MTLDEQETTITIEATDRSMAHVFSNDVVWQRKMETLGIEPYKEDGYGKFYRVSLEQFNLSFRRKRQLSDEQRAAVAIRLNAARSL